jgi:hypothetical protein
MVKKFTKKNKKISKPCKKRVLTKKKTNIRKEGGGGIGNFVKALGPKGKHGEKLTKKVKHFRGALSLNQDTETKLTININDDLIFINLVLNIYDKYDKQHIIDKYDLKDQSTKNKINIKKYNEDKKYTNKYASNNLLTKFEKYIKDNEISLCDLYNNISVTETVLEESSKYLGSAYNSGNLITYSADNHNHGYYAAIDKQRSKNISASRNSPSPNNKKFNDIYIQNDGVVSEKLIDDLLNSISRYSSENNNKNNNNNNPSSAAAAAAVAINNNNTIDPGANQDRIKQIREYKTEYHSDNLNFSVYEIYITDKRLNKYIKIIYVIDKHNNHKHLVERRYVITDYKVNPGGQIIPALEKNHVSMSERRKEKQPLHKKHSNLNNKKNNFLILTIKNKLEKKDVGFQCDYDNGNIKYGYDYIKEIYNYDIVNNIYPDRDLTRTVGETSNNSTSNTDADKESEIIRLQDFLEKEHINNTIIFKYKINRETMDPAKDAKYIYDEKIPEQKKTIDTQIKMDTHRMINEYSHYIKQNNELKKISPTENQKIDPSDKNVDNIIEKTKIIISNALKINKTDQQKFSPFIITSINQSMVSYVMTKYVKVVQHLESKYGVNMESYLIAPSIKFNVYDIRLKKYIRSYVHYIPLSTSTPDGKQTILLRTYYIFDIFGDEEKFDIVEVWNKDAYESFYKDNNCSNQRNQRNQRNQSNQSNINPFSDRAGTEL